MAAQIWSVATGHCFVTFAEHTAAVTGLAWLPSSTAVVSSSLDGTVRAFDLVRCGLVKIASRHQHRVCRCCWLGCTFALRVCSICSDLCLVERMRALPVSTARTRASFAGWLATATMLEAGDLRVEVLVNNVCRSRLRSLQSARAAMFPT